jgi:hypothetical protein
MKAWQVFMLAACVLIANFGPVPTVKAIEAAPSIIKLVSDDCPAGLTTWSTDGSWAEVSGITDVAVIPGGLALVGSFNCGGVNGGRTYYFGLWDGTKVSFPADQPTQVEYAVEYYDGYIWVGRHGRYPVLSDTRPAVGSRESSAFNSNQIYRDYIIREFISDGKILLARAARNNNVGTAGDLTRSYTSGAIEGYGLKPGNWNLPSSSEGLLKTTDGLGWISSCIGDRCYQINDTNRANRVTLRTDATSTTQSETAPNIQWPMNFLGFGRVAATPASWCSSQVYRSAECGPVSGLERTFDAEFWNNRFWVSQASGNAGTTARGTRVLAGGTIAPVRGFVSDFEAVGSAMFGAGRVDSVALGGGNTGPWRSSDGYLYLARWLAPGASLEWLPGEITSASIVGENLFVSCSAPQWRGGQRLSGHTFEVIRERGPIEYVVSETDTCAASMPANTAEGGGILRLRVAAIDADSQSSWSSAWDIEATEVPSAPTSLVVLDQDGALAVSWAVPAVPNRAEIRAYEVEVRNGAGLIVRSISTSDRSTQLAGLVNGTTYAINVRACNVLGCGPLAVGSGTPAGVPSIPRNVAIVGRDELVQVSWQVPLATNGAALTGYEATLNGTEWVAIGSDVTTWTSVAANGQSVVAQIRALNRMGASAAASSSPVVPDWTPPTVPRNVRATPGDGLVTISWDHPALSGSRTRTAYRLNWRASNGAESYQDVSGTSTSATISGLTNGNMYEFFVSAVTNGGEGPAALTAAAPAARAAAPTSVRLLAAGNHQIRVQWVAPASDGGSALTAYRLRVWALGNVIRTVSIPPTERTATILSLPNEVDVRIDVHAVTSAGESVAGSASGRVRDTEVSAESSGNPGVLYPFRDGYGDLVSVGVLLRERVDVSFKLQSRTGTTWLTKNYAYAKGDLSLSWNGRSGTKIAGAGTYTATWTVTDLYGNRKQIKQTINVSSKKIVSTSMSRTYSPQKGAGSCYKWDFFAGPDSGVTSCAATPNGAYRLDVSTGFTQRWQYVMAAPISGLRGITGVEIRVCGTISTGDTGDVFLWSDDISNYRSWERINGDTPTCRDVQLTDPNAVKSAPSIALHVQAQGGDDPVLWVVTSITITVTGTVLK